MKKNKKRLRLSLIAKSAIYVFLTVMVCTTALIAVMYSLIKRTTVELYETKALQISQTLANVLTGFQNPSPDQQSDYKEAFQDDEHVLTDEDLTGVAGGDGCVVDFTPLCPPDCGVVCFQHSPFRCLPDETCPKDYCSYNVGS